MQLLVEKELKRVEGGRYLFLISPRSNCGKSTFFLNLLQEFQKEESVLGVDLDVYNPLNLKSYFQRCMTLRDFETMGFKYWRTSSRLMICKKLITEIPSMKGIVVFNLTPGMQEDNILLLKNLPGYKVLIVRSNERYGRLARRLMKHMTSEDLKPDGIVETLTVGKRLFENFAKRYEIEYLGDIPFSRKVQTFYDIDNRVYERFLEVFERIRERI